jgi:hypothetical protein
MTLPSMTPTVSDDFALRSLATVDREVRVGRGALWRRPELKRLGSVAEVTAKVTNTGKWDGAFVLGMSRS